VTRRQHRVLVSVLIAVGALCIFVSTLSIWIRDTALDPAAWEEQSAALLESPEVRTALATYIVDEAYAASDVRSNLEESLSPELKPLAGPAAAQLQNLATQAAERALARPRVQEAWRATNRAAHEQLLALIEGETERVTLTDGAVVLDVDAVVANVADRIGIGEGATQRVQERIEPIVIMESEELSTVQSIVNAIKVLSIWPFLLGLILWAGAVYLAAGRRRETIRALALSLIAIGVVLLAARRIAGDALIESLVEAESMRAAARDVWSIFSTVLADSAVAGIVVGLLALGWVWLAGASTRATTIRRVMTPTFRDRAVYVHGALAAVILLLLIWGPVGTPRRLLSLVVLTVLAFVGLELIRRQAIREFPGETGDGGIAAALSQLRIGAAGAGKRVEDADVERLERLAALHERGALTDAEYEAEKSLLLG
jgi:hypothetical protein